MAEAAAANHRDRRHSQTPAESQQRVFLRALLVRLDVCDDIESDTGYDTRRRAPGGAFARVSQTTVYDTG